LRHRFKQGSNDVSDFQNRGERCYDPSSEIGRSRRAIMLSRALTALAALFLASPVLAGNLSKTTPEKVGLSSEQLQRLTSALESEINRGRLPGAVLAIARKGQLAYFETLGYRDAASKAPMPPDAIFSIASMTKPMVSVAAMMLHDEGKLVLSD